ncbi:Aste57867_25473 [Aphanomyces stellatus]|uniref:Aste57867_25473 protein n=1 Tax=Aphanomyces stellatus TaxID=120398 RepID=A0A485LY06_9STRA|nr:hypothetical protein As57867_025394 [Aphanomyces stellatus]VFU02096.1 Aste57867_25473 [Aphanomyces stellatus]
MRRRSTNGVVTRSRKQLMVFQGYDAQDINKDDAEMDEYIQTLDDKIDAAHAKDDITWEDYESSSSDEGDSDDDEDGDYGMAKRSKARARASVLRPGFLHHVWYSSLGLALVVPVIYYRWTHSIFPLAASSILTYVAKVCLNWVSLFLLACFAFAGLCNTTSFLQGSLFKLPSSTLAVESCAIHLWSSLSDCVLTHGADCYAIPACHLPLGQVAWALACLVLFFRFYMGRVQLLLFAIFFAHHGVQRFHMPPTDLDHASTAAMRITALDPTFAYANESIHVLVDGANLHEDLVVGWVAHWGCSHARSLAACPKQLMAPLRQGGVTVSFPTVDEYTICLVLQDKDKLTSFECFDDVRLRVKDTKSKPGWSVQGR